MRPLAQRKPARWHTGLARCLLSRRMVIPLSGRKARSASPARALCAALALLVTGCYAGIGPTVGVVTSSGTPTLGWEISGFTVATGQSYALGRAGERPWRVRTYSAWEPRIGLFTRDLSSTDASAFGFAGLGGTLGAHWEVLDDGAPPGRARFLGGVWLGGGYAFPVAAPQSCGGSWRPYLSFAIGFRADEVYFAPKFGALDNPGLCLNIGYN